MPKQKGIMTPSDLCAMREIFSKQQVMLCFSGPVSRGLLEEIGNALRNYLSAEQVHPNAAMDVFAVFIELTQNIRHYVSAQCWTEQDSEAIVVISHDCAGHYSVCAGNLVEPADGEALLARIENLARLDPAALKQCYKTQLHQPRAILRQSGAGLGLIDIARKSSQPMRASTHPMQDGRLFFCLSAFI
jgi:hypothetical protein